MAEDQKNNKNSKKKKPFNFYWIYAIIALVLILLQVFSWTGSTKTISESEFMRLANVGSIEKIKIVNQKNAEVYLKKGVADSLKRNDAAYENLSTEESNFGSKGPDFTFNIPPAEQFRQELNGLQKKLNSKGEKYAFEQVWSTEENWGREILSWLIPIGIMVLIWVFIMRRMSGGGGGGGQLFNIGKSKAQVFEKGKATNITFKDVAGLEGAKEEVEEIVSFLKDPKKYTQLGAKIPKGALLVGPPGTGKTLLAKAVAGEAGVPFFSISGSDFVEMFVGVGASRVRDLFKQAKDKAPCIIFIDEIDAIGRARGKNNSMGGSNDERENTLNQLLTEMDGFGTNSGVIILGASNRGDVLDKALLRAGRFDRQIQVDMPDLSERKEIFHVHVKPLKMAEGIDVNFLAKQTPGFSGADIANLCNEAALIAARNDKEKIELQDFLDAVDRLIGGLEKKNKIISKGEKKTIAYHESGHATVSWLLKYASPLVKVTIVPRGRSLGAAWYLPEERSITTTEQILDEMCAALGGRAAEEIIFGKISTGALSDLEKVTQQATAMVSIYGLNKKIGNKSYYDSQGRNEYGFTKPYSEATAQTIDEEVSNIIEEQYERAKNILMENKDKLQTLAEQLLENEVIFKETLLEIFGKQPWQTTEDDEKASLNDKDNKGADQEASESSKQNTSNGADKTSGQETSDDENSSSETEQKK